MTYGINLLIGILKAECLCACGWRCWYTKCANKIIDQINIKINAAMAPTIWNASIIESTIVKMIDTESINKVARKTPPAGI